jgi:very-short-patch-repair endonuclease
MTGYPWPGCPPFEKEYRFDETRKFRFDYAWPAFRVAVEIEGAIWSRYRGGHGHPSGILRDMEKGNLAALNGWHVFRFTTDEFKNGYALNFMLDVFKGI